MAWDFETEPEFEEQLAWMRGFVKEEIFPLETLGARLRDHAAGDRAAAGPGEGRGPVGGPPAARARGHGLRPGAPRADARDPRARPRSDRSSSATTPRTRATPSCWRSASRRPAARTSASSGCSPSSTGKLRSAFSMTEPETAGSDPTLLQTRAVRDGDEYVINGHKWFTSNGSVADFLIVMAVTNPDVHPYQGSSMILVPTDTPGVDIVRDVATMEHPETDFGRFGNHAEIYYRDVRVPVANLIGREGEGFTLAQQRLGPGRIHHCMRWLGQSRRAFDMLCERAVSRTAHGSLLAEKQTDPELGRRLAGRDAGGPAHDPARGVEDGQGGRAGGPASRSR